MPKPADRDSTPNHRMGDNKWFKEIEVDTLMALPSPSEATLRVLQFSGGLLNPLYFLLLLLLSSSTLFFFLPRAFTVVVYDLRDLPA